MKKAFSRALFLAALSVIPLAAQQFTASASLPSVEISRAPAMRESSSLLIDHAAISTRPIVQRLLRSDPDRLRFIAERANVWPEEFSGLCPAATRHAREFAGAYAAYTDGMRLAAREAGVPEGEDGDFTPESAERRYRERFLAMGKLRHAAFEAGLTAKALAVHLLPKLTAFRAPIESERILADERALAILDELRDARPTAERDALRQRIESELDSERNNPAHRVVSASAAGCMLSSMPAIYYPYEAKRAKVQGGVKLRAQVDRDGVVRSVRLEDGHPALALAAMEGVRRFRYFPYRENGRAVPFETTVTVNFAAAHR
jgi:TonB family protein